MSSVRWTLLSLLIACGAETAPEPGAPAPSVEVLIEGSSLQGANGIARAGDRLYVAGAGASRIQALDPDTGEVLEVYGAELGVRTPDDVAVGPDGSVYWTELLTGEIGRLSPDGQVSTLTFVAPGINPIAFSPDGRLFTATCLFTDALYEVDPTGEAPPRIVATDLGGGCALNGAEFGPDGWLYGAQPLLGRLVRIDVDTAALEVVAEGLGPTAYAVTVAPDGTVYAVDGARLIRVEGGEAALVADLPEIADNLLLEPDGRLLVSTVGTAELLRVDPATGEVTPFAGGGLYLPQGLALDEGALLVVDGRGVERFDPSSGSSLGLASGVPFAAATLRATDGRWISAVPFGFSVYLWEGGAPAPLATDLAWPLDALLVGDEAWVAEGGTGRILALPLAAPDQRRMVAALDGVPAGLAQVGDQVYATDLVAGEVLEIGADPPRVVGSGFSAPSTLAAAPDGALVLVDGGTGEVWSLDPADGARELLADGLTPADPPLAPFPTDGVPYGLVVAEDGAVYVSDPLANRVLRVPR